MRTPPGTTPGAAADQPRHNASITNVPSAGRYVSPGLGTLWKRARYAELAVNPGCWRWTRRGGSTCDKVAHRFPLGAALAVVDAGHMDIIDLDQKRREREEPQPEHASCECGEAWFELRGGPTGNGAVCMTRDGCVTGYAGTPCCVSCGKPVTFAAVRK